LHFMGRGTRAGVQSVRSISPQSFSPESLVDDAYREHTSKSQVGERRARNGLSHRHQQLSTAVKCQLVKHPSVTDFHGQSLLHLSSASAASQHHSIAASQVRILSRAAEPPCFEHEEGDPRSGTWRTERPRVGAAVKETLWLSKCFNQEGFSINAALRLQPVCLQTFFTC